MAAISQVYAASMGRALGRSSERKDNRRSGRAGTAVTVMVVLSVLVLVAVRSCDLSFDLAHGPRYACSTSSLELIRATTAEGGGVVRERLAAGDDPDAVDAEGNRALACAAMVGNEAAVRALLEAEADPTAVGEAGGRPIVAAVSGEGSSGDGRADPDRRFFAPLRSDERIEILHRLGEHGAPLEPALGPAVQNGNVEAVRLLLADGADPDGEPDRPSPLMIGAHSPCQDQRCDRGLARTIGLEMMNLLLEAGAHPDEGGQIETSPALLGLLTAAPATTASGRPSSEASEFSPLEHLFDDFRSDRLPGRGEVPPLVAAAVRGDNEAVALLLVHGADPNRAAFGRVRPLWAAVLARSPESVALLLASGADPRPDIERKHQPIELARSMGETDLVTTLATAPRPGG